MTHLPIRLGLAGCLAVVAGDVQAWTVGEGQIDDRPWEFRLFGYASGDFRLSDGTDPPVQTLARDTRRLRLGTAFVIRDSWRFYASGEFSDRPELRDFAVEWRGWPVWVALGRFQEPFGLGEAGSAFDTILMERPSATALGPDSAPGILLSARGDAWGLSAGAFHGQMKGQIGGDRPEDSVTLRATALPIRTHAGYVHIGAGASFRKTDDPLGLQLSGSSESSLIGGLTPISPNLAAVDRYRLWNAELAVRFASTLFTSEYIDAHTDNHLDWHGWYAELGWAVTGERRGYSTRYGAVGNLYPLHPVTRGGIGAVELAARAGETDLTDGGGDRGRTQAIGLNWYPVDLVRLSVNALWLDRRLATGEDRDGTFVQGRIQVSF